MTRLSQLLELLRIMSLPGAVPALLTWKPFSVTAYRMLHSMEKKGLRFNTVIDGGANKGQFARACVEFFPDATVYAFEPLADVATAFRRNLADKRRAKVFEYAIGARNEIIEFWRHAYTLQSSALRTESGDDSGTAVPVQMVRLDDVLSIDDLEPPILLKLDLQGYELEALRGAPIILDRTDAVIIETAFQQPYEGGPPFSEVYHFMLDAGFRFSRPVDFLYGDDFEIIQMDALFMRRS